jgi:hypothetical protein
MEITADSPERTGIRPKGRSSEVRCAAILRLITVCECEGIRFDGGYIAGNAPEI